MTTPRTATVKRLPVDAEKLGYFRFGRLGEGWIVTNEHGEWHHFDDAGFRTFLSGDLDASADRDALVAKGFVRQGSSLDDLAASIRRRKRHVGAGPSVHVLRLAQDGRKLAVDKAKDILDFAMLSTSAALELRLVPGDLPVDLDLLGFLVQYATEKNRYEGKALTWKIVVDPAALDDAAVTWLADKRFELRAPITAAGFSDAAAARVTAWREAAAAKRRECVVTAEVTVDAASLAALPALPDALAALGVKKLRVEPVVRGEGAVDPATFGAAYRELLARLLGLGAGAPVEETAAAVVHLATQTEPGADVTLRSPSAGGLAAYDVDGRILPSEAALGLDEDMFVLGTAGQTPYKEATSHATLRALTVASLLECLPGFADHWATPFLGVDPVRSFTATGDVFPKGPTTPEIRGLLSVVEAAFSVLVRADEPAARLRAWAA